MLFEHITDITYSSFVLAEAGIQIFLSLWVPASAGTKDN
jgi:hypothetical protein